MSTKKETTKKVEKKEAETQTTEVKAPKVEEPKIEATKTKIKLVCDVFYKDKKYKAGEVLELEKEELNKFSESFYKKA